MQHTHVNQHEKAMKAKEKKIKKNQFDANRLMNDKASLYLGKIKVADIAIDQFNFDYFGTHGTFKISKWKRKPA